MTDTNKTSGADVLAFFDDATVVYKSAVTGSQAEHLEGVTVESVIAACGRIKGRLENVEKARAAVAAMIAERDAQAKRIAELEASHEYLHEVLEGLADSSRQYVALLQQRIAEHETAAALARAEARNG